MVSPFFSAFGLSRGRFLNHFCSENICMINPRLRSRTGIIIIRVFKSREHLYANLEEFTRVWRFDGRGDLNLVSSNSGFNLCNINFFHLHHGFKGPFRNLGIWIGKSFDKRSWSYLPRQTPFVGAPAAGAFLSTILNNCVPVFVCFGLILG